jgi:dimethylaniline monooxygenase (N-oxide forming)
MIVSDDLIPALRDGRIISVYGLRRIRGARSVELDDDSIIDDVDAIIACTGYHTSFDVLNPSVISFSKPHPDVRAMPNLYQNIFPLEYADSLACLNYVVLQDNAATAKELAGMAVAQIWAGKTKLPSRDAMISQVRIHQAWFVQRCLDSPMPQYDGLVQSHDWLRFVNIAAGTGVYEHLGWTLQSILFFLREPSLYLLMAWGVHSPHIYRVFETGKRKAWSGARAAILHINHESDIDLGKVKTKADVV